MQLFTKEQINKKRKDQTRELMMKNDRLIASNRKVLALQKEIEFDADKAKKVKDYQKWCEDLQEKMSKELKSLNAYKLLVEEAKEEYYNLVARKDEVEDRIADKLEELAKLELQVTFTKTILEKSHA
jgi:Mg2+ and Co2+ transporter CorA